MEMTIAAQELVKEALDSNAKIIFADETVFTKATLPRMTYAAKGKNITVEVKDLGTTYHSALAGISTDGIVEHLKVTEKAINAKKYISYLKKLRKKLGDEVVYLFVDNLSAHKTKAVMESYDELQITPIFNSTYAPDYNPIETVFAQVKLRYKEMRLNKLANRQEFEEEKLIRKAFSKVEKKTILQAIKKSVDLLLSA